MSRMLRDYAYQGTDDARLHSDPQDQLPEHHRALLQEISSCTQSLVAASSNNNKGAGGGGGGHRFAAAAPQININNKREQQQQSSSAMSSPRSVISSPLRHARKKKERPVFLAPIVISDAQVTMLEQKQEQERQQQQQNSKGKKLQAMQSVVAGVQEDRMAAGGGALVRSASILSDTSDSSKRGRAKRAVMFLGGAGEEDGKNDPSMQQQQQQQQQMSPLSPSGSFRMPVLSHFDLQQQLEDHAVHCTELRQRVFQLLFDAAKDPAAETSPPMLFAAFNAVLGLLAQHDHGAVPQVIRTNNKPENDGGKGPTSSPNSSNNNNISEGRCTVCGGAAAALRNALGITVDEHSPSLTNSCAVQQFYHICNADTPPEALSVLRAIFRRVTKMRDYRVSELWLQILEYFFIFPAVIERVLGHAEALSVAFRPQAHSQSSAGRANRLQLSSLFASDSDEEEAGNACSADGLSNSELTARAAAAIDAGGGEGASSSSSSSSGGGGDGAAGSSSSSSGENNNSGNTEEVGALPRVETNKDYLTLVRSVADTLCRSGLVEFIASFIRDLTQQASSSGGVGSHDVTQATRLRLAYLIRIASLCEGFFIDHDFEQQQQAQRIDAVVAAVQRAVNDIGGFSPNNTQRELFSSGSGGLENTNASFASAASSPGALSNSSFASHLHPQQALLYQQLSAAASAFPPRCSLRGLALDWISQRLRYSPDVVNSTEMRVLFGAIGSSVSTLCAIVPRAQLHGASSSSSSGSGSGASHSKKRHSSSAGGVPLAAASFGSPSGLGNTTNNNNASFSVTLVSPTTGALSPISNAGSADFAACCSPLLGGGGGGPAAGAGAGGGTFSSTNSPAARTALLQQQVQRMSAIHRAHTAGAFTYTVGSSVLRSWGALPSHPHLPPVIRFTDQDQSQHDLLRFASFVVRYLKKFCATFGTAAGAAGASVSWDDESSLQRKQSLARVKSILEGPKSRRSRSYTMKHFSESVRLLTLAEAKFLYRMLFAFNHVLSLVHVPTVGAMEGATTIPASAFAPLVQIMQLLCDQHRLLLKRNKIRRERAIELEAAERRAHREAEAQALHNHLPPPPPPMPRKIPGERAAEDEAVNRAIACAAACAARLIPRPVPTGQFWEGCEPLQSSSSSSSGKHDGGNSDGNKHDNDDDDDHDSDQQQQQHQQNSSNKSSDANFVSTVFTGLSSLLLRGKWSLLKMLPFCPLDGGDLSRLLASLTADVPWFPRDRQLQAAVSALESGNSLPGSPGLPPGLEPPPLPPPASASSSTAPGGRHRASGLSPPLEKQHSFGLDADTVKSEESLGSAGAGAADEEEEGEENTSSTFQMPEFKIIRAESSDAEGRESGKAAAAATPSSGLVPEFALGTESSICVGSIPRRLQHLYVLSQLPPYVQAWRAFGFDGPLKRYSARFCAWVNLVNSNLGNQYVTSLRHVFNTAQDALRICEVCLALPARLPTAAAFDEDGMTEEQLADDKKTLEFSDGSGLALSPVKVAQLANQRATDRTRHSALGLIASVLAEKSERTTHVGLVFATLRDSGSTDDATVKERAHRHSTVVVRRLVDNGLVDIPLSVLSLVEKWVKSMEAARKASAAARKQQQQVHSRRPAGVECGSSDEEEEEDDDDDGANKNKSNASAAAAAGVGTTTTVIPWFQTESQDIFAFAVRQLSEAAEYSPEARKRILEHKILAGSLQQLAERIFETNALAAHKLDEMLGTLTQLQQQQQQQRAAAAQEEEGTAASGTGGALVARGRGNSLEDGQQQQRQQQVEDDDSGNSPDEEAALASTAVLNLIVVRRGFFSGLTAHVLQRALNSGGMLDRLKLLCEVAPHLAAVAKTIQERDVQLSIAKRRGTPAAGRSRGRAPATATTPSSTAESSISFYQTPFFANAMFAVCCVVLHGLPILNPEDVLQDPSLLLQAHEALHSVIRALTALCPDPDDVIRPSSKAMKEKSRQIKKQQQQKQQQQPQSEQQQKREEEDDDDEAVAVQEQQFCTMSLLPIFKLRMLKFQPWYKDLQMAASQLVWRSLQSDSDAALCNVRTLPHPEDDSAEAEVQRRRRFTVQSFQKHVRLTSRMRKLEADRIEQAFAVQRCLTAFLEIVEAEAASRDAVHRRDAAARRRYAVLNEQRAQLDRFLSVDRRGEALQEEYDEFCAIERLSLEDIERIDRGKNVVPVEEQERARLAQIRDFLLYEYQYRIQHVYGPESVAWNSCKREATLGLAMVRKHYGKLCDLQLAEFNGRNTISAAHKKRFDQNIAPLWARAVIEATETRTRRLDVEAKTQESYSRIRRDFFNATLRVFQRYEAHVRNALLGEYKKSTEDDLDMHFDMLGVQADESSDRREVETMFRKVFDEIALGWLAVQSDWLGVCERAARERILIEASEAQYGPKHWIMPTLKEAARESAGRVSIHTQEAMERAAFTRAWVWACQLAILEEERALRRNITISWAFNANSIRFSKQRALLEDEETLRRRMEERGYHDDLVLLRQAVRQSADAFRPQLLLLQEHAQGAAAISSEEGWLRTGLMTLVRERLLALRKILREYEKVAAITAKILAEGGEIMIPSPSKAQQQQQQQQEQQADAATPKPTARARATTAAAAASSADGKKSPASSSRPKSSSGSPVASASSSSRKNAVSPKPAVKSQLSARPASASTGKKDGSAAAAAAGESAKAATPSPASSSRSPSAKKTTARTPPPSAKAASKSPAKK